MPKWIQRHAKNRNFLALCMDHEIKKIVKQSLNLFDYEKYIPLSKSGKTTAYFAF